MCNIREVVLQEYDLQMYKGNNLERGMYLGMVCFRHTVVYIFEDAGILILVSFCTIQKKKQWYSPLLAENAFRLKPRASTSTSTTVSDPVRWSMEPNKQQKNVWIPKYSCTAQCHDPNDSYVSDFVLDLELRRQTADPGSESKHSEAQTKNLVAKGTLIKTLHFRGIRGIWDLKLVDWINIFAAPRATVLYLTFWKSV